jgi:hypothetical protein
VLEIGSAGQRVESFIGKLLGENAGEARASFLARHIARGRTELEPDKLEPIWLRTAKALYGQCQALLGMSGDRQHAPREIVPLRPQVEKRFLSGAANLPRQTREHGHTAAVLANLDGSSGTEVAKRSFELSSDVARA